jgi:TolB protein
MDPDGKNVVRLTTNDATDELPTWSSDGTKIAFQSAREGVTHIFVMNADGTDQRRISNHKLGDFGPSFSPDGARVAYQSLKKSVEIFEATIDGDTTNQVTSNSAGDFVAHWQSGNAPPPAAVSPVPTTVAPGPTTTRRP